MKRKSSRNKNGTYRNHPGRENTTWHSTRIKIGKEFKRQKGRKAKPGDIVRDKNKNGTYNKGSPWHIMTNFGWRKSKTGKKKPTKSQISNQIKRSKPGRGK
jgi:hypothetical protein